MSDWTMKCFRDRVAFLRSEDTDEPCSSQMCWMSSKHTRREHLDETDEDAMQLLALVDRMLDRIAEAQAAIITGEGNGLDALNAAVSDANGVGGGR